jgi:superfamily II DNA or RNA helicase
LGRVLRPKSGGDLAHFYTLVSRDTREQDFAHHRQLFLTEQGYSYRIADGSEMGADYTTRIDGELTTGVAPSANPSDWDPEEELMDDLAS